MPSTPLDTADALQPKPDSATASIQPRTLSTVPTRPVRWLWPGRIPFGKLTVLDGGPDLGKSTLLLDLVARLTTGRRMPHQPPRRRTRKNVTPNAQPSAPPSVLLLCDDDLADTVRPRLEAAGADLDRVVVLPYVPTSGSEELFQFPRHIPQLARLVVGDCALVVIDSLEAYLSPNARFRDPLTLRRIYLTLSILAEATGAAVVVVRRATARLVKWKLLPAGGDHDAGLAIARAGLLVAADPWGYRVERRILVTTKNSLAAAPPPLGFCLETARNGASVVVWEDRPATGSNYTTELLDQRPLIAAVELLESALANGPVLAQEVLERADRERVSRGTLRRAKTWLRVRSTKLGPNDPQGPGWLWAKPEPRRRHNPAAEKKSASATRPWAP